MRLTAGLGVAAGMTLACAIGLVLGMRTVGGGDEDVAFGRKVRAYILTHPEVVAEAANRLRIEPYRQEIETPFASAWAGNPKGDVTLVMFTDYNCPYCRASTPVIERLLATDPRLRIVWREMPVLGPGSDAAASAALAAARLGRFPAFHHELFSGGHPDQNGIAAAAKSVGIAPARLEAAMKAPEVQAEIAGNLELARQLGIVATPFFVVGNRSLEGAVGYERLRQAIIEARGETN